MSPLASEKQEMGRPGVSLLPSEGLFTRAGTRSSRLAASIAQVRGIFISWRFSTRYGVGEQRRHQAKT